MDGSGYGQKSQGAYGIGIAAKFAEGKGMLRGEDSTSYLTSKFAAQRISIQEEEIKLIFMLEASYQARLFQLSPFGASGGGGTFV